MRVMRVVMRVLLAVLPALTCDDEGDDDDEGASTSTRGGERGRSRRGEKVESIGKHPNRHVTLITSLSGFLDWLRTGGPRLVTVSPTSCVGGWTP
jgi:hypothetical protein